MLLFLGAAWPAYSQNESLLQDEISLPYLEKLVELAKKNYPGVKSIDARVHVAEKDIKKTKLTYFDIFSFSYLLSPSNATSAINPQMLNGYQLGFFVNIGSLIQKPILIKQAKDQLEGVEMERNTYLLNLEAEVKQRYYAYAQAKAIFKIAANSLLDAEAMADDFKYRFERGEITFDEYNTSLMSVSTRLQTKINYESTVLVTKVQLEELLGQKLENIR